MYMYIYVCYETCGLLIQLIPGSTIGCRMPRSLVMRVCRSSMAARSCVLEWDGVVGIVRGWLEQTYDALDECLKIASVQLFSFVADHRRRFAAAIIQASYKVLDSS